MWLVCLLLVTLLLARPAASDAAALRFGPREYTAHVGAPVTLMERFDICRPERAFRLRVENGREDRPRVSSGTLTLNGVEVVRERDFNQRVPLIERSVALQSSNTLAIRLAGPPGGVVAVSIVSDTSCVEIAFISPAPGAEVPAGFLAVRGTVRGAAGAGVAVNGVPAFVDGEAFVGLVPVDPSVGELVAVATAPDGTSAESRQALSVVPAPEGRVRLRAARPGGLAPLATGFSLSSLVGISRVALDLGDGSPRFEGPSLEGQTFTYVRPGVYTPTVRVTDTNGLEHTAATVVHVYDPTALDARLQAVWHGFKDALRAGDVGRAVTFLHGDTRDAYGTLLRQLGTTALANVDQYLTAITLVEVGFGGAQYEMLRQRAGQTRSFAVWFQLDTDGVWRLRRF